MFHTLMFNIVNDPLPRITAKTNATSFQDKIHLSHRGQRRRVLKSRSRHRGQCRRRLCIKRGPSLVLFSLESNHNLALKSASYTRTPTTAFLLNHHRPKDPPPCFPPKGRVLCTEDDLDTRDLIVVVLRQNGFDVTCTDDAHDAMIAMRWANGQVVCPTCGAEKVTYLAKANLFKCYEKHPRAKFSLKVGTIFEDSPLGLDKWLTAIWLIANAKNGISSCELSRSLGITQKSAWHVLHRIRLAMQNGTINKLSGSVEVDETFIGGKARNMHRGDRARKIHGTGGSGKVAVMGLLERHGEVRTMVVPNMRRKSLHSEVSKHVEAGLYGL